MGNVRGRRLGSESGLTRAAILASALDVFALRGFAGANIRDVAKQAHVDPALVHYYFRSKSDLFRACLGTPAVTELGLLPQGNESLSPNCIALRLAEHALRMCSAVNQQSILAAILSREYNEDAASHLDVWLPRDSLRSMMRLLGLADPDLHVSLIISLLLGTALERSHGAAPFKELSSTHLTALATQIRSMLSIADPKTNKGGTHLSRDPGERQAGQSASAPCRWR